MGYDPREFRKVGVESLEDTKTHSSHQSAVPAAPSSGEEVRTGDDGDRRGREEPGETEGDKEEAGRGASAEPSRNTHVASRMLENVTDLRGIDRPRPTAWQRKTRRVRGQRSTQLSEGKVVKERTQEGRRR